MKTLTSLVTAWSDFQQACIEHVLKEGRPNVWCVSPENYLTLLSAASPTMLRDADIEGSPRLGFKAPGLGVVLMAREGDKLCP